MKKILFVLTLALAMTSINTEANAAKCNVKAVNDPVDGAVYYGKDHRLHKFVKLNKGNGDKALCSKEEAMSKGFRKAPNSFSNSTARMVECVQNGVGKCMSYVVGQYRSLEIYDKACAGNASKNEIIDSFLHHAQTSQNRMDVEKFYGTTGALMDAYPCGRGAKIARK